jgi:hypothetical protein
MPPLSWAALSPRERAQLRLYWRTYAATQPDRRRAFGMAAALGRYVVSRSMRRSGPGAVDPLDPVDPIDPV